MYPPLGLSYPVPSEVACTASAIISNATALCQSMTTNISFHPKIKREWKTTALL